VLTPQAAPKAATRADANITNANTKHAHNNVQCRLTHTTRACTYFLLGDIKGRADATGDTAPSSLHGGTPPPTNSTNPNAVLGIALHASTTGKRQQTTAHNQHRQSRDRRDAAHVVHAKPAQGVRATENKVRGGGGLSPRGRGFGETSG
jgi:hypothetical protein